MGVAELAIQLACCQPQVAAEVYPHDSWKVLVCVWMANRLPLPRQVPCYSNTAMCYLKLQKWAKAKDTCDKLLKIEPENTKVCLFPAPDPANSMGRERVGGAGWCQAAHFRGSGV